MEEARDHDDGPKQDPESGEESTEICRLISLVWFFGGLCTVIQCHSLAKLIAAFICEDAVWNFPNQCVQVD
ncbi:GIP [Symbiodinium natans]|uniref:GIP protein n=1 Tax=Symbiodinium natans TaxID=878477 RepID=A0A812USD4_9DINO|nr:GIP [Symbiodinium natans]